MWNRLRRPIVGFVALACLLAAGWVFFRARAVERQYEQNKKAGETLAAEGSYAEAVDHLQLSLKAAREAGSDQAKVDEVLSDLGDALGSQGQYVETQHVYTEALQRNVAKYGNDHPQTAQAYDRLARSYELQDVNAAAEGIYNQAIAVWEKVGVEQHPESAASYRGLGNVLTRLERPEEAAKAYARALELRERAIGKDNPELAPLLRDYANVLTRLKREPEANALVARADALEPPTPTPEMTSPPSLTPAVELRENTPAE